jgi:cytochrome c5
MHANDTTHSGTGPVKSPKQLLSASLLGFIVPIVTIIGLASYVASGYKASPGSTDMERSVNARIQKVGTVEIRDANRPLKTGEQVYQAQCGACHTSGALGAPKLGDSQAWDPRVKQGYETLFQSALKGKNAMAAQGGGAFNDLEIARAVVFLANKAGAGFSEPKAPEAAK